jgi:hypothetical protein
LNVHAGPFFLIFKALVNFYKGPLSGYTPEMIFRWGEAMAVMLTAHALTPDSIVKSYKKGAVYFVPKEEMARLPEFLNGILKAKEKGKSTWLNWLEMLTDAYWEKRFGPNWKNKDWEFWENFPDHDYRPFQNTFSADLRLL